MSDHSDIRPARRAPEVYVADIILPGQTNPHNTMFGGEVMAMMDKAAAIAALRFCRQFVVTASSERVDFRTPIHIGEIIEAAARVIYAGRTSLIVRVRVDAEDPLVGERRNCTTGYFSMVSIGADGRPLPVPELLLEDDEARAEWALGEEIRRAISARRRS